MLLPSVRLMPFCPSAPKVKILPFDVTEIVRSCPRPIIVSLALVWLSPRVVLPATSMFSPRIHVKCPSAALALTWFKTACRSFASTSITRPPRFGSIPANSPAVSAGGLLPPLLSSSQAVAIKPIITAMAIIPITLSLCFMLKPPCF
ncbi:MAG: hypothetical protein FWC97_11855, partial [Treponema sp.]|nr:hypothetical protein [Treponema sp.]